ncbi:MAG: TA system VapC family ribonuclease toxin [Terriglobia bacterium]
MILPDVNVLVYAFRNDALGHRQYREWLDSVVNGDSAYAMSPQVLSSVVRICTHRAIFPRANQVDDALAFCRVLIEQPHCQIIQPGARHWSIFADLCQHTQASGNLVQDAWFAALAIEHGCEWITTDRHYSRFPGLRWRPPF